MTFQTRKGFPDNFLWGGAIAACQSEGAYDVDGRRTFNLGYSSV